MTLTLDKSYLETATNGAFTVGDLLTNTLTQTKYEALLLSIQSRLETDGLIKSGSFITGAEWGAAYLIADVLQHAELLKKDGDVKQESWGGDYSYTLRETNKGDSYYIDLYTALVESLNQNELGISEEVTEGVERADSDIWFSHMDRNPLPDATSRRVDMNSIGRL